jgi:hypothetical protein
MAEHPERNPDRQEVQAGHEPSGGVSVRGIVVTIGLLAVLLVFGLFVSRWLLDALTADEQPPVTIASPLRPGDELPPGPRVDPAQARSFQAMTREKRQLMTGYGSVDPAGEIGRIPVDKAVEILAERGLDAFHDLAATPPAKPADAQPPANEQDEATP